MVVATNAADILNSYRKTDAVIIVCQNNTNKNIEIAALNDEALRVCGFSNEALVGKDLSRLLPERIQSILAEYVEYEADQNDLMHVLNKLRNFAIKTADGKELQFKLRIIRGELVDKNPCFHLVLIDENKIQKREMFRAMLRENFKGHEVIDEHTGLPDRASITKDLQLVLYYVRSNEVQASFAVIEINQCEKLKLQYGEMACLRVHQHIGALCKQRLRAEDTVGSLSENRLAIIMVDAAQEPARMVLNRLRWVIGTTALQLPSGDEVTAQASVGFSELGGNLNETEVIDLCEKFMKTQPDKAASTIHLIVTHERREHSEQIVRERRKPT